MRLHTSAPRRRRTLPALAALAAALAAAALPARGEAQSAYASSTLDNFFATFDLTDPGHCVGNFGTLPFFNIGTTGFLFPDHNWRDAGQCGPFEGPRGDSYVFGLAQGPVEALAFQFFPDLSFRLTSLEVPFSNYTTNPFTVSITWSATETLEASGNRAYAAFGVDFPDDLWDDEVSSPPGSTPPPYFSGERTATFTVPAATSGPLGTIDPGRATLTIFFDNIAAAQVVPEPATLLLVATGLLGVGVARRARRSRHDRPQA